MVSFGLDTYHHGSRQKPVATVNGTEITHREYSNQYERIASRFREQLGENFGLLQAQLNLKQQTLDFLINNQVINDFTKAAGLSAGVRQVEDKIKSYPYFSGGVTKSAYDNFLRATGLTGVQLEKVTKEEIVRDQIDKVFGDLATPTPDEIKAIFVADNTKIKLNYLTVKSSDFVSKVASDDADKLKTYFENNADRYRVAKQVNFNFLELPAASFKEMVSVTEEDLKLHYEQHQPEFTEPKRVQPKQIFFKVEAQDEKNPALPFLDQKEKKNAAQSELGSKEAQRARAEEVVKKLADGAKFEDLVRVYSEDSTTKEKGGDMGVLPYESLFPELRAEAVKLLEGEHSGVIESKLGLHVIFIEKIIDSKLRPFDEVKTQIEESIRMSEAPLYAGVEAESLASELSAGGKLTLQKIAADRNLKVAASNGLVALDKAPTELPNGLVAKVMELSTGDKRFIQLGDSTYLIEVLEAKDPYTPLLDEVRERVTKDYIDQQSRELARTLATDVLSQAKTKIDENPGEDKLKRTAALLQGLANEHKLEFKTSDAASKISPNAVPFTIPALRAQAFNLSETNPLIAEIGELSGSYYIASLAEKTPPVDAEFEKQRVQIEKSEGEKASNRLFEAMLANLKAESEIWINPEFLAEAN